MSNSVFFTALEFTPTHGKFKGQTTYGFIAVDDYAREIEDGHESPMPDDDKEFFCTILDSNFQTDVLDGIVEEALYCGAYLNDAFYDADTLKTWYKEYEESPECN